MASAAASSSPGWGARSEAERWLEIAGRLLHARDLVGSKRFAERAMEVDPLLSGVDEILAVADVLLASQRPPLPGGHPDYYSILQSPAPDPLHPPDPSSLKLSFRRLSLLLSPSRNPHPGADLALRHVSDAWSFLSDPSRKLLFDQDLRALSNGPDSNHTPPPLSSPPAPPQPTPTPTPTPTPPPPSAFWTVCTSCFRAHEYERSHLARTLRCPSCHAAFPATELPSPPPIVPGTDMYYCSWGLFPLGFPGCPAFAGVHIPDTVVRSPLFLQHHPGGGEGEGDDHGGTPSPHGRTPAQHHTPVPAAQPTPPKKQTAKKPTSTGRPRGRPRKDRSNITPTPVATAAPLRQEVPQPVAEDVHEAENVGDIPPGFDMNSFTIDLDATADALGTFAHLPFMRDDEVVIMR